MHAWGVPRRAGFTKRSTAKIRWRQGNHFFPEPNLANLCQLAATSSTEQLHARQGRPPHALALHSHTSLAMAPRQPCSRAWSFTSVHFLEQRTQCPKRVRDRPSRKGVCARPDCCSSTQLRPRTAPLKCASIAAVLVRLGRSSTLSSLNALPTATQSQLHEFVSVRGPPRAGRTGAGSLAPGHDPAAATGTGTGAARA